MAGDTQNIGDLIRKLVENNEEVYSLPCTVVGVSGEVAELAPLNGDANILGVKLISGTSTTALLITPTVNSVVIATFLSKDTAFIGLYSEIDTIAIRGDQYGGLIKIDELVENLDKLTVRVDGIIEAIETATPIPQDGGVGYQTAMKLILATLTNKEDFTGLENEAVKHG